METDTDGRLGESWHAHRAHLINVAFRILGDIGAAEDAVQEAYSRLLRTTATEIDDERGWLTVVTSRICLDQIRSARSRLDRPLPVEQVEIDNATASVDPADRVTLDDSVGAALHVMLRWLSPAERVVFVMHDVFQIPFDSVSETVGRSASTCRQLATRARRRIAEASDLPPFGSEPTMERQVIDAFIGACAGGDISALLAVLDPDVSGDGNFGPDIPAPPLAIGAPAVARRTLGFLGHGATLASHPSSTAPALLAFIDRRLLVVLELTIANGLITHLHADGHPTTLEAVAADLAGLR